MTPRKQLPIGIQTFARLREDGCYYVDKTAMALQLIQEGNYYFLSRPRRFGKSLFLDTLAELFAGNEPLFRGLAVHSQWDWSTRFPVIRLSFGGGVIRDLDDLRVKIAELLGINEQALGLAQSQSSNRARFGELIRGAERLAGQRVVVLVDEYDKPILDNLGRPDAARDIREDLRDLYSVIKDHDAHIRFSLLTGISRFSKVSLFSGLNNLNDISLDPRYSALCGYTETDLDTVFAAELDGLDRVQMRRWYNGYNWTGEAVYNPFDILLLFRKREWRPYWFETGTPTFLIELLTARQAWLPGLGQLETDAELLSTFEVDNLTTEALMFQAGYLTIDEQIELEGNYFYRLRYPNREVWQSLHSSLLNAWVPKGEAPSQRLSLLRLLKANDFQGLRRLFEAFFSSIPHDWYRNNPIAHYEGYYASVFFSHFAALGLDVRVEDATSLGRIDMTVLFNRQVYLFEFKVVADTAQGHALEQVLAKGYADKYRGRGEPIHLIGVEVSRALRSLVAFDVTHA